MRTKPSEDKAFRARESMAEDAWIDILAREDWLLLDGFMGREVARALHGEVLNLFASGLGRPAAVGRGAVKQQAPAIRQDEIVWLDEHLSPPGVGRFLDEVEKLRQALNRLAYLGVHRVECHAAHYRPGAFYKAHRDSFAEGVNRLISFVYFLNPDWTTADAGELRLLSPEERDITPLLDRLVLFNSRTVLHEVLPTRADRYTLTGWMSGRDERGPDRGGIVEAF